VAAISVGGLKCRIQFWKGTTQGSSQQSLVEIGSVVSVENIFFNFIPLFSIFSWLAILVESRDHRTLVMGIGNVFKIDDRYINIERLSIIGDNGDHSPNFFRQTSLLFHEWLAERFNLEDA
jgi:hypothetical protein